MNTVYIHADESCLGNQNTKKSSPGGAGGLVEVWKDGVVVHVVRADGSRVVDIGQVVLSCWVMAVTWSKAPR